MTEQEKRKKRCCFAGHRPQKLSRPEQEIKKDLEAAIIEAIKAGYTTFITGMAYGVDIWAGEIVVRLKQDNPELKLIAAVPFKGFENRWTADWKKRYQKLLEKADLVKYICPSYSMEAYQQRNKWMVDHSTYMIAIFNGQKSGTGNAICYAQRRGMEIKMIRA